MPRETGPDGSAHPAIGRATEHRRWVDAILLDPALQPCGVGLLADRNDEGRSAWRSLAWAIALVTATVLVLSAAGIYALMSFTVAHGP